MSRLETLQSRRAKKAPVCGAFAKPSSGLEPETSSSPSRLRGKRTHGQRPSASNCAVLTPGVFACVSERLRPLCSTNAPPVVGTSHGLLARLTSDGERLRGVAPGRRRGVARVARPFPRRESRGLACAGGEGKDRADDSDIRAGASGGALLWLDRRSGEAPGRSDLSPALYAAAAPQRLVEAERGPRRATTGGRSDATRGPGCHRARA